MIIINSVRMNASAMHMHRGYKWRAMYSRRVNPLLPWPAEGIRITSLFHLKKFGHLWLLEQTLVNHR